MMNWIRSGSWAQMTLPTGHEAIRRVTRILRQGGYRVSVSSMGQQVTPVGRMLMTLITVRGYDGRISLPSPE